MWGNGKKHKTAKIDTLVGSNTEMRGDIVFKGGLHIDGVIKGNVIALDDQYAVLILSENGRIEGEVQVPNVSINGAVVGDIHAISHLELAQNAKVHGSIHYTLLEMASGAEVNGQLIQRTAEQMEKARPDYDVLLKPANDAESTENAAAKKH